MVGGIFLIVVGLICILVPKSQYHKNYMVKHNYTKSEDFMGVIGNIVGGVFIGLGIVVFFVELFSKTV